MQLRTMVAAYAGAHFGKSLLWHCSGLFFAFYLTEVAGLTPEFMGAVLAASLVLNAFCDLSFGALMGRWVRDLPTAAAAQALGAVAACLAFLAFAALKFWPAGAQPYSAIISLMAFRVGYSLLDVPQNTVLAFVARDDVGRTQMASLRYVASGAALLIVTLALAPWLTQVAPEARADAFFVFAAGLTPITLSGALLLWWVVARTADGLLVAPQSAFPEPDERHNGIASLVLPLASIAVYSSCMPFFSKLEAYLVAYADQDRGLGYFMVAVAVGQVAGQFVWMQLAPLMKLITLYRCAAGVLLVLALVFGVVAPMGGMSVLLLAGLIGAASSGLLAAIWAFLARSAAGTPAKAMLRFGQLTFCSKLAQAASAVALGHVLGGIGYRHSDQVTPLIWAMALGPLLTAILCSALGVFFDRRRQANVLA